MPNAPVPQPPAPKFSVLAVVVNGQAYNGWTSAEVTTGIDAMAGAFEIETTDRWPGQPSAWALQTGDAVTITIDGELRLTGWIDEVEPSEEASDHSIKARGLGRTGDLVDCSAMNTPGRWKSRKLEQIASDLCGPFGISVTATADTGAAFPAFAIQQGEAVKDALDRLVQQRGLLLIETPTGDLQIASPAQTRGTGALVLAGSSTDPAVKAVANLIKASAKHSARGRFSVYVVKGQRQGNDHDSGKTVSQVTATVYDPQVTRYRPLMIQAEDQASGQSAKSRAIFAATARAGRAQTGKLTTPGFRDGAGALWVHNNLVPVTAPDMGLQGDLLIQAVRLRQDSDGGQVTEVSVIRPEAYSLGEVKGAGLSRLDNRVAGKGAKGRSGRKGGAGPGIAALANLPS